MYYVIGKYLGEGLEENQQRSQEAFERALEISPDLAIAHNLYASLEFDLGQAKEAMLRLVERAKGWGADPELFAGLVHACRYCGLLDASVAAHEQARRLDPKIRTSVVHAYYQLGDYPRVLLWKAADVPYLRGMTLVRLGRAADAARELTTFVERAARDLAAGKRDESVAVLSGIVDSGFRDPEGLYYWAGHFAYLGELERAISVFKRAVEGGFFCYPAMARDSGLDPLRAQPEFNRLLYLAETRHREAVAAFLEAGGDGVLGLGGT